MRFFIALLGIFVFLASVAPARAAGTGVTVGSLQLTATFESIGVELFFTGDDDADATAELEFKKVSDATWRKGLPLWRTADGSTTPGRAFYGSALLLDPNSEYDVRVTVRDPDGVVGAAATSKRVKTRTDGIPAASTLSPTHFVRTNGNDANAGTSSATAWRTIEKAVVAAPDGAVVQVGPGYYAAPTHPRTLPLTLTAQYPAVDGARNVVNAGNHSVIEGGPVSGPATATEAGVVRAPWVQMRLADPADATKSYAVWKWAGTGRTGLLQLGFGMTRAAAPTRVANWAKDGADLATPAGWAKKLYTNLTYNHGFYVDADDLYLRLPGDRDPNTVYVTAGTGSAFTVDGPNVRISGLEIRQFEKAVVFKTAARFGVVDACLLSGNRSGVRFDATKGPPSVYGSDHVVQGNRIVDSTLWTSDHVGSPAIPWTFIKSTIKNADGSGYPTRRIGAASETAGVTGSGGARRVVVRRNTVDGTFNGVGTGPNAGYDRYAAQDMDVHDNTIRHIADDALEPEESAINFRAWNNRLEYTLTALSTGPVRYGPVYLVRNEAWRTGNAGVGRDRSGDPGVGSVAFKFSGASNPTARIFVLHNTVWTDQSSPKATNGGAQWATSGSSPEAFYLRNNILRAAAYAFVPPAAAGRWDEDYNHFSTTDAYRGLEYRGTKYTTDVAAYRAASGQGGHTNVAADFVTKPDAHLANPASGDLSLSSTSAFVDRGVPVPNISDRAGVDYRGTAPDLGARER